MASAKFTQLIATSGFCQCTKFVFGRGSAPNPGARTYSAPPDPGLRGSYTFKGKGRRGERRGKGEEGTGEKGKRGKGREE